ncbi:hypothetical protein M5E89_06100 [Acidaminococcus intestini]|nr:hypothetical protein M5E89_06100 [Acidaminococcus intestini]
MEKGYGKKAMNPCPIDFSEFHSSNPRAHTVQKEYDGQDHSNFNRRQKYADDEEPQFTTPFGEGPGFLPVEAGRYRLIWSRHCPWAHRIAIAIDLLGLDQVISKGLSIPCVLPVLLVIGSSPLIPTALTLF